MTKPIEGWIVMHPKQGFFENDLNSFSSFSEHESWLKFAQFHKELETINEFQAAGWRVRHVRVTFTDEATRLRYGGSRCNGKADLGMAFVAGAAWRKDDEVADAIRKDREMIWDKIQDIDLRIPDWVSLQRAIFGEEK